MHGAASQARACLLRARADRLTLTLTRGARRHRPAGAAHRRRHGPGPASGPARQVPVCAGGVPAHAGGRCPGLLPAEQLHRYDAPSASATHMRRPANRGECRTNAWGRAGRAGHAAQARDRRPARAAEPGRPRPAAPAQHMLRGPEHRRRRRRGPGGGPGIAGLGERPRTSSARADRGTGLRISCRAA